MLLFKRNITQDLIIFWCKTQTFWFGLHSLKVPLKQLDYSATCSVRNSEQLLGRASVIFFRGNFDLAVSMKRS